MTGLKYKLAHKRADKDKWNVTQPTQRKRLIKVLKDLVKHLEKDPMEIAVPQHAQKSLNGAAKRLAVKKKAAGSKRKSPVSEEELMEA